MQRSQPCSARGRQENRAPWTQFPICRRLRSRGGVQRGEGAPQDRCSGTPRRRVQAVASSEHQEAELLLQCGVRPWGIQPGRQGPWQAQERGAGGGCSYPDSGERSGRRNSYPDSRERGGRRPQLPGSSDSPGSWSCLRFCLPSRCPAWATSAFIFLFYDDSLEDLISEGSHISLRKSAWKVRVLPSVGTV